MVAEPKPHQTGRKRQNVTKTGNDWWVNVHLKLENSNERTQKTEGDESSKIVI